MNRKLFWLFCICITLLAVFFRFFKLGSIPVSLYWDEVAILADARIVVATGHDMHNNSWFQAMYPSYGDYKLPGYIWLATLSVRLFGNTEFAVRFPSAMAGLLTMLVGFLLVKELTTFSKKTIPTSFLQLAVLITICTSFWSIMFSRTAFEGHLAQSLVGLSIVCVFLSKKRPWLFVVSALLGAFAVYTYYSVRFVWPVIFIMATLLVFTENFAFDKHFIQAFKKNQKNSIYHFLLPVVSLGIFFALLLPMNKSRYYGASQQFRLSAQSILQQDPQIHEANYYRLLSGNTVIDRLFFHRDILTLKLLASNYSKHLSLEYIFLTGDPNLRHGTTQHGLFALIAIIPFFLGLFLLCKENKKVLFFLLIWWLISLLPASVPTETPHALRSLNALLPISIIISYGLTYFFVFSDPQRKIISGVFWLIFILQIFAFWHHYLYQYPKDSAAAWQDGYKQLAEKIYAERGEYKDVWITVPDKRLYLWFLAYSYYSPEQIQSWEKPQFQLEKVDRISFQNVDVFQLNNLIDPHIIVANAGELERMVAGTQAKHIKTEYVLDSFGKPIFVVGYFDNQHEN